MTRYQFGCAAEEQAARHYESRGGCVVSRRFKVREGEIDLIVWMGPVLVFIEVKARRTLETAAQSIKPGQIGRLQNAALAYVTQLGLGPETEMRFDAVLIDRTGGLEVIENMTL